MKAKFIGCTNSIYNEFLELDVDKKDVEELKKHEGELCDLELDVDNSDKESNYYTVKFDDGYKFPTNISGIHFDFDIEESLTEAEEDELSDDELDELERKERDELEARFKSRRDSVAASRKAKADKLAHDEELKKQAQVYLDKIGDDWSFENLFYILLPSSGKCDTLAGELLRAANKIDYRWWNDGDRWFEDYGIETCGQAAYFLMMHELNDELPFYDLFELCAEYNKDEDEYDEWEKKMVDFVCDHIRSNPQLLAMETEDMYDFASRRDVEEYFKDHNLIPTYDYDCSIPPELDSHLEKGNISERDLIWEIQSWIENMGGSTDDVSIDWGNVYIYGLSKADYEELEDNLYSWLEDYAQELTDEYGDPDAEVNLDTVSDYLSSDDFPKNMSNNDIEAYIKNILETHSFDTPEDAADYIRDNIQEETDEAEEGEE